MFSTVSVDHFTGYLMSIICTKWHFIEDSTNVYLFILDNQNWTESNCNKTDANIVKPVSSVT